MAWVDTHTPAYTLRLNEAVMKEILNSDGVRRAVVAEAGSARAGVVVHVNATASARNAANYVNAMFFEDSFSDEYGFDFNGPYELGNRPIAVVGVRPGRGSDPTAKPPLLVESQTHSLTSVQGFTVGSSAAEDIR